MAGEAPSLFDALDEDERHAVLAAARENTYDKGDVVFHAGDIGDCLHHIERGHIAIRASTPSGDIATLAILGPCEVFGEHALIDPRADRSATVVALEPVTTRSLNRAQFEWLRAEHHNVDRFLLEAMAATIRRVSEQLMEALYVPADTRVLRRVADLADTYAVAGSAATIVLPVTQDDVATLAGVARPTANRILRAAQDDGLLAIRRGRLEILRARRAPPRRAR